MSLRQRKSFIHAATEGNLTEIRRLVENNIIVDVNNCREENGETALFEAAAGGHLPIVRYLVETCKCDVNHRNDNGFTPLMRSSCSGHLHVVKYLVEQSFANVNIKNNYGETALSLAACAGHILIVKYLVEECKTDIEARDNEGKNAIDVCCDLYYQQDKDELRIDIIKIILQERERRRVAAVEASKKQPKKYIRGENIENDIKMQNMYNI